MKAGSQPLPFRPCASWPRLVLMLAVLLACPQPRAENRLCLSSARRAKLARLVQADADAANLFKKLKREADASLHDQPHPIGQLATAGTFASDPAKVESRSALEDMKKLEALGFVYAVTTK